jgi:pimeloyl-ACP methyl ester carboxylesterase
MTPTLKSIELSSGIRLPYVEQGDSASVAVLLLHGFTDCRRRSTRLPSRSAATATTPNSRLISYASAGHGLHWEEPARFAADVSAFAAAPGG